MSVQVNTNPVFPLADVEFFTVDAGSPTLVPGNCVCLTTTGTVTLAVAAALAVANAVLGVCITGGVPGATVQVRENGFLSPTISGLGGAGLVRVNPATGNLQIVNLYAGSDYPMGGSTSTGWLTMQRLLPNVGGGGVSVTGTGFWHSTAGALDPAAATVLTQPTTNPAASGFVRVSNNQLAVAARNSGATADIPLLGTDASNNINLGDTAAAQGALTVINGTTGISLKSAGVQIGSLAAASGDFIRFGSGGAAVSTTGYIRTQNGQVDQTVISGRNPTNTTDVPIVSYQGGLLVFGGIDAGNTGTFIDARLRGGQVTMENLTMQLSLVGGAIRTAFASSTLAFNGAFHGNNPFVFDSADNSVTSWDFKINGSTYSAPLASFAVAQGTVNSQDGTQRHYTGYVRSTTTGNVTAITIPTSSGRAYKVLATFTARDVSGGTVGDTCTQIELFGFKNVGGTLSATATTGVSVAKVFDASLSGLGIAGVVSGTNILLQVGGIAATTLDFVVTAEVTIC